MQDKLSIYVHLPFCVRKCLYCDFVSGVGNENTMESYVNKLLDEIDSFIGNKDEKLQVDTIFFGGGTPSVLPAFMIDKILCKLKSVFAVDEDGEISIEVNPGTADKEKLDAYRKMGINRLSIGLQSTWDEELRTLGRIHTYKEFLEVYKWAREAGFTNINVDLMSALPGQSKESYEETLMRVTALGPEHISAYSLIVEEGTPFGEMELNLPDEDTEREMYEMTRDILADAGYVRYEISNYAKAGYECRHNVGYWTGKEYLGFGVAAASYFQGKRWKNQDNRDAYLIKGAQREEEIVLSLEDKMSEFMFLGLRMSKGVSAKRFYECFGKTPDSVFGEAIERHIKNGLLKEEGDALFLTSKGTDLANYVMSDFILDENNR